MKEFMLVRHNANVWRIEETTAITLSRDNWDSVPMGGRQALLNVAECLAKGYERSAQKHVAVRRVPAQGYELYSPRAPVHPRLVLTFPEAQALAREIVAHLASAEVAAL